MKHNIRKFGLGALLALFAGTGWAANANFTTDHFSGSQNCGTCHNGLSDQTGADVSIEKDWSGSMMANATRDPLWRAKLATELDRAPHLTDVINDKCTKCHAPMANYEAKKAGISFDVLGVGGLLDPANPLHDAAMDGVSCTLCHQIGDDPTLGTLEGSSGHYTINPDKEAYGQFVSNANPMLQNSGYTPTFSTHVSDSALCATCHDLKTPYTDAAGNIMTTTVDTEFPEQMVYSEWEFSDYAQAGTLESCQDCHMPHTDGVKIANRPRQLPARDGMAKHELVGANTVMMNILQENAAALDVTATDLPLSIERARAMLQTSANIEVLSTNVANGLMDIELQINNTTGHKLPTSYPSRRAWLHLTVRDAQGQVVFESGKLNADGSIVGADGDIDAYSVEPHYDLITSEDQVQIYESVMGNTDGQVTYTLLRGAQYLKDNRITPLGFDKANAHSDIAVVGNAFDDADFDQGIDQITYRVPVVDGASYTVQVEMMYQPIQYGFLLDLYSNLNVPEVAEFKTMYDNAAIKWETITSANASVSGAAAPAPAPTVTLSANPTSVTSGNPVDLTWSSTDADSCTASGDWNGTKATAGSEASAALNADASFTLTCSGAGGSASSTANVTVTAAAGGGPGRR